MKFTLKYINVHVCFKKANFHELLLVYPKRIPRDQEQN